MPILQTSCNLEQLRRWYWCSQGSLGEQYTALSMHHLTGSHFASQMNRAFALRKATKVILSLPCKSPFVLGLSLRKTLCVTRQRALKTFFMSQAFEAWPGMFSTVEGTRGEFTAPLSNRDLTYWMLSFSQDEWRSDDHRTYDTLDDQTVLTLSAWGTRGELFCLCVI
jgi:hypothetical protein